MKYLICILMIIVISSSCGTDKIADNTSDIVNIDPDPDTVTINIGRETYNTKIYSRGILNTEFDLIVEGEIPPHYKRTCTYNYKISKQRAVYTYESDGSFHWTQYDSTGTLFHEQIRKRTN